MISLCRLCCLICVAFIVSGCSTVHNAIGSDKPVSELRAAIEAPVEVAESNSVFCKKPVMEKVEPVIAVIPEKEAFPFGARLFFMLNETQFTAESNIEAQVIYRNIVGLNPREVVLVGNTDTTASAQYNDALSLRRAQRVKQDLIQKGIPSSIIRISAAGEHRPLIETPDNTVEKRNRRVEIFAR